MLESGFLLEPLTLGYRPLRDSIQTSFVVGSDPFLLKDPSGRVAPIPGTQPVIGPNVMKPEGYLSIVYWAHITKWALGFVLGFALAVGSIHQAQFTHNMLIANI